MVFCCRAIQKDSTNERSEQGAILEGPDNSNALLYRTHGDRRVLLRGCVT